MKLYLVRGWVVAVAVLALPARARAQQLDTNPPVPNVLLLLDNSGSMERMIDNSLPEASTANTCNCDPVAGTCVWTTNPVANRWGTVQQALTGQLANGYNCVAMPRTAGSVFANEYAINGTTPATYDINYYLPFHRMVARDPTSSTPNVGCVIAPGILPGAATGQGVGPSKNATGTSVSADAFVSSDVIARSYGSTSTTSNCTFSQLNNGALDSMNDLMRFGLMTFDQDPSSGTGIVPSGSNLLVGPSPVYTGGWSYYPGWNTNATCPYVGSPVNCAVATMMAVGARNPAAPPWEGRMVRFPSTNAISTQEQNNSNIQDVIRSSRPYGATPLAGMLTDAQYYFWTDPTGPQQTDVFTSGDCRQQYIIVLTDGAPNDDLRPDCAASGTTPGVCPFLLPQTIASTLYNGGQPNGSNQFVTTYVIGFAVSTFQDVGGVTSACSSLVSGGQLASRCATALTTDTFWPCCQLQEIANAGGSTQAYFADTPGDLQNALGAILANIAKQSTTRTVPAYSPVITNVLPSATTPNQNVFYASFSPSPGQAWSGDLQRSRYFCGGSSSSASGSGSSSSAANSPTFSALAGDDFEQNLNSTLGFTRTFIAFEPDLTNSGTAWGSIRPFIAATPPDGVVTHGATTYAGIAANVVSQIQPGALFGITTTGPTATQGCPYTPTNAIAAQYMTPSQCRDMTLDYTFAQPASAFSGPSNFAFTSRAGNAFGDVYHASPAVVGPPGSLLQDPSYESFQLRWSNNVKCGTTTGSLSPRPTTAYVATNDGLLHAFWTDETTLENNEQWAMLMPATMQNLLSTYPSSHQFLLDGSPIVKDVVWDRTASSSTSNTSGAWHTTLVAGYGPYQRGYYAIDVTDPCPPVGGSTTSGQLPASGPVFRWQLTTMPTGNYPIFGNFAATPAITTLFMNPDGLGARDIGVAILPGGWDGPPSATAQCTRQTKVAANYSTPTTGYTTRPSVRCWGATQKSTDPVDGRSVSIVRLDTGEILRVFAPAVDYAAYTSDTLVAKSRITATPFDSPMTGTPVVYPPDIGADATKFFVGDADGTMWRFDVSNPLPQNWTATLFLDLYNATADTSATSWGDGQPFEVTPVISLDAQGELVINAATGTTETFDNTATPYYVYSVAERVQGSTPALGAAVNWFLGPQSSPSPLRQGERVSGPMTVFNGTLYFSTYYAGTPASLSCTSGDARLWGLNFNTSYTACTGNPTACGNGGLFTLDPTHGYLDIGLTFPGRVVPGVAVQATPACGTFGSTQDSYVGGATHQTTTSFTPGQFSLVALMGGVTPGGLHANPYSVPLPTPVSPTLIDSWAAVLE
jgi:type IV pilus assembly protein PilY1